MTFDGASVTVTKTGFGPDMQGSVRLPIDQITGVTVKPATALVHGYIQFHVRNQPTAPIVHLGLAASRPHRTDPLSMSFARKRNDAIGEFQQRILAALPTPPATTPRTRSAAIAIEPDPPTSSRNASATVPTVDRQRGRRTDRAAHKTDLQGAEPPALQVGFSHKHGYRRFSVD